MLKNYLSVRRRHLSFGKEDYSKKLPSHDGDAAKLSDFDDNNLVILLTQICIKLIGNAIIFNNQHD
jgi:hypothetical protein